jgi:phosphonate transport system substrate-binding protein
LEEFELKKIGSLLAFVLLLGLLSGCAEEKQETTEQEATTKQTLKIGAIPDQDVSVLSRSMGEVADYLSAETGLEVEYVPSVDYAALVTAFERGEIQLAWFGGLTGVQARSLVPDAEAIAQRPRDEEFHSVFIAQKELGLTSLSDLKGKSFTFGSESSTSGHLMPRYYLMEEGIDADTDLNGKPSYSGSHDKTYKLVESGAYQAGALNEAVWEAAVAEGKVDMSKVEVFYTTPAYFDYHWTINTLEGYDKNVKQKITDALLSMDSEQQTILDLFQTDQFIETKNENYKAIEKVAKQIGIIK